MDVAQPGDDEPVDMTASTVEGTFTRVMLVDDQELVRSGLRRILRRRDGFEIVVECADGGDVPAALAEHDVDVVVMDLRMKGVGGIEATRRLRADADAPPVLVLTTFETTRCSPARCGPEPPGSSSRTPRPRT